MLKALSSLIFLLAMPSAAPVAQEAEPETPAYLAVRNVAHGTIETLSYRSESLDREREAVVYLPPGYAQSSARYPVLYLLHGAGGTQRTWIDDGRANVILDNLIADRRAESFIVVMPYGYSRPREPSSGRGGFSPADFKTDMEEFAVDFLEDLIPLVESRYRVVADAKHRGIAGLSMGGGQAFAIGLTHPEMFSVVAGFSSAMQIANDPSWGGIDMEAVLANADAINAQVDLLWVGCGTEDILFDANQAFSAQLAAAGVEHVFRVTRGDHTMAVWQRYLHELVPQLFAAQ